MFLTSALDCSEEVTSFPVPSPPETESLTIKQGGCLDHKANADAMEKRKYLSRSGNWTPDRSLARLGVVVEGNLCTVR